MLPTLSPRQKAGLACALAILLWVPMGVSHGDATLITGHSSFYDGDTFSPCLASLAGIMRHRVMWFDDQVLVETYGGKGTFIYVTEANATDPRAADVLYTEGVFYDFVDPNGAHWHVEEMFTEKVRVDTGDISASYVGQTADGVAAAATNPAYENRTYVWVVELASRPIFDEFAGDDPHSYYNFLTIVDTCKMHRNDNTFDGLENHSRVDGDINDRNGHRNDDGDHDHERFMVDIWVGKRPSQPVPLGANTTGLEFETDWAQGEANQRLPEDQADPVDPMVPEAP